VQAVVSEVFAKKKQLLPSLSVVQVGPLPAQGAQVVIESVAESRKPVNPSGLAFLSGQAVATGEAVLDVAPVAMQSLEKIRSAANALGMDPATDVLRVTCYCSSLRDGAAVHKAMAAAFPAAALNHLQLRRVYTPASVNCEAVGRIKKPAGEPLRFINPDGLSGDDGQSQVALVEADRILMSGSQLAFRGQESDIRLALERMGQSLEEHGSSYHGVVMARYYTLSPVISNSIRKMRWEFFDQARPPAVTMVELEGLPSLDASFAMDVVAVAVR
jgi:enamine deaminase RidA (YjgF/YER057c/UK114 family)